jgi:hypothetical protein
MPFFISTHHPKENTLGWFTPICFHAHPPSPKYGLRDARRVVPYPKRWILEHIPAYFNPFASTSFYIEGFLREENIYIGKTHLRKQSPLWLTALKILSWATLIMPLIALSALAYARYNLGFMEKALDERSFKVFKNWILRFRAKKYKESGQRTEAYYSSLFDRLSRGIQKGGEISLPTTTLQKIKVWVAFKPVPGASKSRIIQIKQINKSFDSPLLASAKIILSESQDCLQMHDFYFNRGHSWARTFNEAPFTSSMATQLIARQILGAGARYLASWTKEPTMQKLQITGDLASLLTEDGPSRVLEEHLIISRQIVSDPFSDATCVEAPLFSQANLEMDISNPFRKRYKTLILAARHQMLAVCKPFFLPKHSPHLMPYNSDFYGNDESFQYHDPAQSQDECDTWEF